MSKYMEQPEKKSGIRTLFKKKDFSLVFSGGLISDIGSNFSFIAILFLSIAITSDLSYGEQAREVALVSVVLLLPSLFFGPFAGALVDRFDRKRMMIIADILGGVASFGLIFVSQMYQIYVLAFLSQLTRLFFFPARGASLPKIVEDPELLVSANGLIQTIYQLSGLVGPALAGVLIGMYGLDFAFIVDAISFIVSALFLAAVTTDLRPPKAENKTTTKQVLKDMGTGFSIIRQDRVMSYLLITLAIIIMGIGMINPLFAFYLSVQFGLGETAFGFIVSISSVTGLTGALILSARGNIRRKISLILFGTYAAGVAVLVIGLAPHLPQPILFLYLGMAIVGLINVSVNIPFAALMQTIIENKHLGKVNGFLSTLLTVSQVGGAALATTLVVFLPIDQLFMVIGTFILVAGIIAYFVNVALGVENEAIEREAEAITRIKAEKAKAQQETNMTPIVEQEISNDFNHPSIS